MDARITKHRLGNMLSYDWLKILLSIVAAIAVLCMLFTMIRTRPTIAQKYTVFGFGDLQYGDSSARFGTELNSIFSYEILETNMEKFNRDSTGTQTLMARRTVKEGTVIFAADHAAKEGEQTGFEYLCASSIYNAGLETEEMRGFLDLDTYFIGCEEYLIRFFGEDWESAEIDMTAVRESFMERNAKDKRFRSGAKKEKGVMLERERIESLRDDYLAIRGEICEVGEEGKLPIVRYTHSVLDEEGVEQGTGKSYALGINMAKLNGMQKLFYYNDEEGNRATEKMNMLLFDNGASTAFTRYETVTLLRHMLENYA